MFFYAVGFESYDKERLKTLQNSRLENVYNALYNANVVNESR